MIKKKIAVAIGAALIVGTAWTATALAANALTQTADIQQGVASETTPTAGLDGTATVPTGDSTVTVPTGDSTVTIPTEPTTDTPVVSGDATPSMPTTGAPFGWTVRMLAHMKSSSETSNTPFGWTIRMLAHLKRSAETTMPAWTPGEPFGRWAREWAHRGDSMDASSTLAPEAGAMGAGARMSPAAPKVKAHAPKHAAPGKSHRATQDPAGSSAITAPGRMKNQGGMMGARH